MIRFDLLLSEVTVSLRFQTVESTHVRLKLCNLHQCPCSPPHLFSVQLFFNIADFLIPLLPQHRSTYLSRCFTLSVNSTLPFQEKGLTQAFECNLFPADRECQNIPLRNSHILEVGGTSTADGCSSVEDKWG